MSDQEDEPVPAGDNTVASAETHRDAKSATDRAVPPAPKKSTVARGGANEITVADLIAWMGLLFAIVTAWLYFAGWTYAYAYFDRFNLPLGLVEPSLEETIVYGALALRAEGRTLVAGLGLLVCIGYCIYLYRRIPYALELALIGALVLLGFYVLHKGGERAGVSAYNEQSDVHFAAYQRVTVGLVPTLDEDGRLSRFVGDDCALLLVARPGHVVLIRPRRSAPGLALRPIVVTSELIEWMQLTDDYGSCE